MECKGCGRQLAKNGIKKGVQYYYCTHCKKSYSGNPHKPNHHIFEEYIARLLYLKCVKRKNKFTQTTWTINQIARFLGHHHRDIDKWAHNKNLTKIRENELIKYLEKRDNGFDILCVLGYRQTTSPSENLNKIIHRKKRTANSKDNSCDTGLHITEAEYLRLVNLPIENRKEAIFVLGALLGCRTSEIIGAKYGDIDYDKLTIYFHRAVTFSKQIDISEKNRFITNRTYPLTQRMLAVIEWLKADSECNKAKFGENYDDNYLGFLCVQENGELYNSFALNKQTQDIRDKALIESCRVTSCSSFGNITYEKIQKFKFKWLRYSVKLMMIKAGVGKSDIKTIFGYKNRENGENQLEIMRKAYSILDKYIDEQSDK